MKLVYFVDFDGTIANTPKYTNPKDFYIGTLDSECLYYPPNNWDEWYILTNRPSEDFRILEIFCEINNLNPICILTSYGEKFICPNTMDDIINNKVNQMIKYCPLTKYQKAVYIDSDKYFESIINDRYMHDVKK